MKVNASSFDIAHLGDNLLHAFSLFSLWQFVGIFQ